MNIFYLHSMPVTAAIMQCDKHVVKMILESAQMLCTAHRILDGELKTIVVNGRKRKVYELPDDREDVLYHATHINHPSNVWCRTTSSNYIWLYNHFVSLCEEYTYRYGKTHKTELRLYCPLSDLPNNIPIGNLTDIPLCMPDELKSYDLVESYRRYYMTKQERFDMKWTKRQKPDWFQFHDKVA